jgi:hypothetical protein
VSTYAGSTVLRARQAMTREEGKREIWAMVWVVAVWMARPGDADAELPREEESRVTMGA